MTIYGRDGDLVSLDFDFAKLLLSCSVGALKNQSRGTTGFTPAFGPPLGRGRSRDRVIAIHGDESWLGWASKGMNPANYFSHPVADFHGKVNRPVWSQMVRISSEVVTLLEKEKSRKIHLTGFGTGGAIANLLYAKLLGDHQEVAARVKSVTSFGAPPCTDRGFSVDFDRRILRHRFSTQVVQFVLANDSRAHAQWLPTSYRSLGDTVLLGYQVSDACFCPASLFEREKFGIFDFGREQLLPKIHTLGSYENQMERYGGRKCSLPVVTKKELNSDRWRPTVRALRTAGKACAVVVKASINPKKAVCPIGVCLLSVVGLSRKAPGKESAELDADQRGLMQLKTILLGQ
ncbi:MAG: hypothetical protein AAFV88_19985 [Planctomycetota bacterium]